MNRFEIVSTIYENQLDKLAYMDEPRKPRAEHCCKPPNPKAATSFNQTEKLHKFNIGGIEIEAPNKKTAIKIANRLKNQNK